MDESWTYARAGVDLAKHRAMHSTAHEIILDLSRKLGVEVHELEGYAPYVKMGNLELTVHADGVGTKVIVLQQTGRLHVAGWDAMAMNLNDVVCGGFRPVIASLYVALPESNEAMFREIMRGVHKAAETGRVMVIGGETAILPDVLSYPDVCCFVVAKREFKPQNIREGDIVIGVESNGLHANGYTLARKVLLSKFKLDEYIPELGTTLGEELSRETYIYSNLVLELYERGLIRAAAHITGGAFTKLKRLTKLLADNRVDIVLNSLPEPKPIFKIIQREGRVEDEEMYRVFNMGIGLALVAGPEHVEEVVSTCRRHGYEAKMIGKVEKGIGRVKIVVPGSGKVITYD